MSEKANQSLKLISDELDSLASFFLRVSKVTVLGVVDLDGEDKARLSPSSDQVLVSSLSPVSCILVRMYESY